MELMIDLRKQGGVYGLVSINGAKLEMVESFKLLGLYIYPGPPTFKSWPKMPLFPQTKRIQHASNYSYNIYRCTMENIITWFGQSSAQDRKELQIMMDVARSITQTNLLPINYIYTSCCLG